MVSVGRRRYMGIFAPMFILEYAISIGCPDPLVKTVVRKVETDHSFIQKSVEQQWKKVLVSEGIVLSSTPGLLGRKTVTVQQKQNLLLGKRNSNLLNRILALPLNRAIF